MEGWERKQKGIPEELQVKQKELQKQNYIQLYQKLSLSPLEGDCW